MAQKEQKYLLDKNLNDLAIGRSHNRDYVYVSDVMEEYAATLEPKWIKINSEDDLPKEEGYYWVMDNEGDFIISYFDDPYNWKFFIKYYSKIITKPQLPKD